MNKNLVQEIYSRNYGSIEFYHRNYYKSLVYTEGILDFQKTLNAYWFVDWVIGNMKKVIDTYKTNNDGFFVITIKFDKKKNCFLARQNSFKKQGRILSVCNRILNEFKHSQKQLSFVHSHNVYIIV